MNLCHFVEAKLLMMFSLISQSIKDASVLRTLEFAATFYPKCMPNYWERIVSFSMNSKENRNSLTVENVRQLVENLEVIDNKALASDVELTKEIVMMAKSGTDDPLGVVLISGKISCCNCSSRLHIRADRTSVVTV